MAHLTPAYSRKRPCPDDGAPTSDLSTGDASSVKRQCKSSAAKLPSTSLRLLIPGKDVQQTAASETTPPSGLRALVPGKNIPPTPPSSVAATATMALKLAIPQKQLTGDELAKLNRHRSDAARWKPKLQRPFPNNTEIQRAYPMKLLRHYPNRSVQPEPDFVRPKIDKSPRVSRLLEQFPLLASTKQPFTTDSPLASPVTCASAVPLSALRANLEYAEAASVELQWNKYLTQTEESQHLAWRHFSLPERHRVDDWREDMVHSGLEDYDLYLEMHGWENQLPDWKKPWTGRFAVWPETQTRFQFYE